MNIQEVSIGKQSKVQFLLVTANTGTVFEKTELLTPWVNEFAVLLQQHPADFIALHCQEVGGKDYERFMHILDPFIKALLGIPEIAKNFTRYRLYFDSDYTSQETFTALGSIYFFREDLPIHQWNFHSSSFQPVTDRQIFTGNLSDIHTIRKQKFPPHFYPETKWFRKGFIQTRWSINGFSYDMVNVHLFHDASNLLAVEKSPSVYSQYRKNALEYTLKNLSLNQSDPPIPFAIFGDFNFRLDAHRLVQHIAEQRSCSINKIKHATTDEVTKIVMKNPTTKTKLTIEKKEFNFYDDHDSFFNTDTQQFQTFDAEFSSFTNELFEYPKKFPPSYPYSEEHNQARSYLRARCPAWCDRILLSHSFHQHSDDEKVPVVYNFIGSEVCMGDHKPVYLGLTIDTGEGWSLQSSLENSVPPAFLVFSDCQNRVATTNFNPCIISNISHHDHVATDDPSKSPVTVMRDKSYNYLTDVILNEINIHHDDLAKFNVHDYAVFSQIGVLPSWWLNDLRQRPNRQISNAASSSALWAKVRAVTFMTTLAHRTGSWYSDDQTGKSSDDEHEDVSISENDDNVFITKHEPDAIDVKDETEISAPLRRSFSSINYVQHNEELTSTTARRHSITENNLSNILFEPKTVTVAAPPVMVPITEPQPSAPSRVYRFLHCIIL